MFWLVVPSANPDFNKSMLVTKIMLITWIVEIFVLEKNQWFKGV